MVLPPGPYELRVRVEAAGISGADPPLCQSLHPERYFPRRRHPDWYGADLATLLALLAQHEIARRIAAVRTLDEVPTALGSLAGHGPPGKEVIALAPPDSNRESARRHLAAVGESTG